MPNDRVFIGMMRAIRRPGTAARAAAHAAHVFGADFCLFNPTEVDFQASRLSGWLYDRTQWRRGEWPLPDVVINDLSSVLKPRIWKQLSRRVPFTSPPIGDKEEIFQRMEKGGFYKELQIPTIKLSSFRDFEGFLTRHQKIVVKPQNGAWGRNVFYVGIEGDRIRTNNGETWELLDRSEGSTLYEKYVGDKAFVAQQYVDSLTRSGLPFDIRLHVRRGHTGEWSVIQVYPRIGGGRSITCNVSAGGSVAPLRAFLQAQFGENKGNSIRRELLKLARQMPVKFQALYQDRMIDALGIDIGQPHVPRWPGHRYRHDGRRLGGDDGEHRQTPLAGHR
jgi:hypothetical protein